MRITAIFVVLALMASAASAADQDAQASLAEVKTTLSNKDTAKEAISVFKDFLASDKAKNPKLVEEAIARLGSCVHKDVAEELFSFAFARSKRSTAEYQVLAVQTLGRQAKFLIDLAEKAKVVPASADGREKRRLAKQAKEALKQAEGILGGFAKKLSSRNAKALPPPEVVIATIKAWEALDYRRAWEEVAELLPNYRLRVSRSVPAEEAQWAYDQTMAVLSQALNTLGAWEELRAHEQLSLFWAQVTGASRAGKDTGRYRSPADRKAQQRHDTLRRSPEDISEEVSILTREVTEQITGEDLFSYKAFTAWCREHKKEIEAAERRRD